MGVIKGNLKFRACIGLMKEFNETAKLWQGVVDSGLDVVPFGDGVYRNEGSLAHVNAVEHLLAYDPERIGVDTLIHEAMHWRQYQNNPTLLRSTKFYSCAYHETSLPDDNGEEFVVFTPQALVEAQVAMEAAVWASQVPAMYELCQHIDDEPLFGAFLRSPTSGLSVLYPPLYELGAVQFRVPGGNGTMKLEMPTQAATQSLKSEFATVALAQMNYLYQRSAKDGKAFKDVYAEIAAAVPSHNAEYLRAHEGFEQGLIKFRDLTDEDIVSLGDVWKFNIFKDADIWRAIERSAPLMDHIETKSRIRAANALLEVDKFRL